MNMFPGIICVDDTLIVIINGEKAHVYER